MAWQLRRKMIKRVLEHEILEAGCVSLKRIACTVNAVLDGMPITDSEVMEVGKRARMEARHLCPTPHSRKEIMLVAEASIFSISFLAKDFFDETLKVRRVIYSVQELAQMFQTRRDIVIRLLQTMARYGLAERLPQQRGIYYIYYNEQHPVYIESVREFRTLLASI